MQAYPHHYHAAAHIRTGVNVSLESPGLERIESAAPAEYGGPGNLWSPETLLVAAVADCFVLTFKAIARASSLEWVSLQCQVEGVLDRVGSTTRFTHFNLQVELNVLPGSDEEKALKLLEKAESGCLITNSLNAEKHLNAQVNFAN